MKTEPSKQHARAFFEDVGYSVDDVPVSSRAGELRADLMTRLGSETLVVEAKGKEPHEAYLSMLAELESEGHAKVVREVKAWSSISKVAEKAAAQLAQTPCSKDAPRVLFLSCLHDDWSYVCEAFRQRMYGLAEITLHRRDGNLVGVRPCFYYEHADFLKFTIIDAVVLAGPTHIGVLLNAFGDRGDEMRRSTLFREALARDVAWDPDELERSGQALAVRSDRTLAGKERHSHLVERYGYWTAPTISSRFQGLIRVASERDKAPKD